MANPNSTRCLLAFTIAAAALPGSVVHTAGNAPHQREEYSVLKSAAPPAARAAYVQLPLRFEPAHDTTAGNVFVARGAGYAVSVSAAKASLLLRAKPGESRMLTMSLAGGNADARPSARRVLPGISNYLVGHDRRSWVTGVRGYGEIEYRGVYRGVDIVYYGSQQELEYDFVVAPGASADAIALAFDGATRVSVSPDGDLLIATDSGNLVQRRPAIYQNDHGARRAVTGGYIMRRGGRVGFSIGTYDRRLPLVIDPILSYATYLGGINQDHGHSVAVDVAGNVIVAGVTVSPDFPVGTALQPHKAGGGDAFVAKLNPTGDTLVYSTYFGGSGYDEARGVAVDDAGNAYVAGYTDSWDFPAARTIGSGETRKRVFVVKLDATGALAYATQIGGSGDDEVNGIAVDAAGRAHIAGMTSSADFPVVDAWQRTLGGDTVFRTRNGGGAWTAFGAGLKVSGVNRFGFDRAEPRAIYGGTTQGLFKTVDDGATWTAVSLPPQRIHAVADRPGTAPALFAAGDGGLYRSRDHGESWSRVSPYAGVTAVAVTWESPSVVYAGMGSTTHIQKSVDGGDTWIDTGLAGPVQLLAASGSTVYALTSAGLFRSSAGGAWVAIGTNSSSHEGLSGFITAFAVDPFNPQVAYAGTSTGFFKTTSSGDVWTSALPFPTPVGAVVIAPSDAATMLISISDGASITHDGGQTWSPSGLGHEVLDHAATIAFDPADSARIYVGCYINPDAFVATLSADGSRLEYATYIGGALAEQATSIAVDSAGNRYVTGDTFSRDFPTVQPIQPAFGGLWDSFVVKLGPGGAPVYSTYLGGSAADHSARIAADAAGRAYVTGLTLSLDFPVANASQPVHGGGYSDVFVTALNESGSAFVYSTFLGGSARESDPSQGLGPSIAVTPAGEASVTGTTQSTDFPVTADAWHRTHAGGVNDVFVTRFDSAGVLQYSTFLGGPGADYARDIAVDSIGTMFITGWTDSTDWATHTAVQPAFAGSDDAFVAKISPGTTPPDVIAPTTTIELSGTAGIPGWYNSPVTVSLSSVENEGGRGLASTEYSLNGNPFKRYTSPFVVTAPGTTRVTARATDWAGNVETPPASAAVAIDTTGPVVSFQVTGTFGLAGWLKSAATVTVFGVDILGTGVASVEYRIGNAPFQSYTTPIVISTEGVTQVTARATDRNGNVSTSMKTVSIDTSAPRTSVAVAGTSGLAGWYRSPVTISLSAVDDAPGSAVATSEYRINDGPFQLYAAPFVVSAQGTTQITSRTRDRAGNIESSLASAVVTIDSSVPRTSVALAGTSGLAGWYRSPVTVSLLPVDDAAGSAIGPVEYRINDGAFQPYGSPFVVSGDGTTRITARAADRAGNVESPLAATLVMIDSSAPAVTIASPEARDYQHSDTVTLSFSAADSISGPQNVSAALDGSAVQNSQSVVLLTQTLGAHTIEVFALDAAGNPGYQSVSFRVVATIDSLIASVNIYAVQGQIDASKQRGLLEKLNDAKASLDRGNMSATSGKLREFRDQCNAQSGHGISVDAAAVLTADTDYVLGTF